MLVKSSKLDAQVLKIVSETVIEHFQIAFVESVKSFDDVDGNVFPKRKFATVALLHARIVLEVKLDKVFLNVIIKIGLTSIIGKSFLSQTFS